MERLTNRIFVPKEERELVVFTQGEYIDTIPAEMTHEDIRKVLRRLAEYEEAEEQGLLLRLPCKIGGTVFKLKRPNYCPVGICHKSISCSECRTNIPFEVVEGKFKLDELKKIGKTVFLTQEEAENKLKDMNTYNGIAE